MTRIFFTLALLAVALITVNLVLGLSIGDVAGESNQYLAAKKKYDEVKRNRAATEADFAAAESDVLAWRKRLDPILQRLGIHRLLGIAAVLVALLINCITVTYFLGTSRWCQEVIDSYGLDQGLADESLSYKRKSYPWALGSVAVLLTIVCFGAAADPAGLGYGTKWAELHRWVAMFGLAFIAWSFMVQAGNIGANYRIIERIMEGVDKATSDEKELASN